MSSSLLNRQLLDLPVEISLLIIELLPETDLVSFCLTSKLALTIAQPYLYKDIKLSIHFDSALPVDFTGPEYRKLFRLRRTLETNEILRNHIKIFELDFNDLASHWDIDDPKVTGVTELMEFAGWFPSVRSFTITFNFFQSSTEFDLGWRLFIKAARNMPKLEELYISGGSRLDHPTLLQLLHPLPLKFLSMNCSGPAWRPALSTGTYTQVFPLELESLKDLEIEAGEEYTDLSGLLPWCTKLQSLTLGDLALGVTPSPTSFTLNGLLDPVKFTLRELTLRFPSRIESKKMKLHQMRISELTGLHSLFLMDWMIEQGDQPLEVYDALFSGSLKKILWFYNEWSTDHRQLTVNNVLTVKDAFGYGRSYRSCLNKFELEVKLQRDNDRYEQIKTALLMLEDELKDRVSVVECVAEYLR